MVGAEMMVGTHDRPLEEAPRAPEEPPKKTEELDDDELIRRVFPPEVVEEIDKEIEHRPHPQKESKPDSELSQVYNPAMTCARCGWVAVPGGPGLVSHWAEHGGIPVARVREPKAPLPWRPARPGRSKVPA